MIVQPIVEGYGEVNAIPLLLRRIFVEVIGCNTTKVASAMRLPRGQMVKEDPCRKHLRIAQLDSSVGHVLLLLDADDDCCMKLRDRITPWGEEEIHRAAFDVIGIEKEYECWLLAGLTSLRGIRGISDQAEPPPNPARLRDAKSLISAVMPNGYSPTVDQTALTACVDLSLISLKSKCFSRLLRKLTSVHSANCDDCSLPFLNEA